MELTVQKTLRTQVAVVGGGTAGCFAAVSAAAAGASVVLIEKNGILGGTVTTCGVNYPGLFYAWGKQIIGGFPWKAIKRTEALGGCVLPTFADRCKRHWEEQIRLNSFVYSCVLDDLCEETGVTVLLHTALSAATEREDGVELLVTCKEGVTQILADRVIDAGGDANLTQMLGYPTVVSDTLQPATLVIKLDGYDRDAVDTAALTEHLSRCLAAGELPAWTVPATVARGVWRGELRYHVPVEGDADTSTGKSRLERRARRDAMQILTAIRGFEGLGKAFVSWFGGECGVRETRRIVGEITVTAEDYITGRVFEDAVCYAFYPIDLHVPPYGIKQEFFKEGVCATVPYRALIPKGSARLLVAGRILSSDTDANSALRVQAPCMAMGQAAGCAAARTATSTCSLRSSRARSSSATGRTSMSRSRFRR